MAYPNYFKNFPNVKYAVGASDTGQVRFQDIKDYFVLSTLREDLKEEDGIFYDHIIQDGESPELISFEQYGDEQYYWIILQLNGITDYYNDWPLSQVEFDEYILRKYGSEDEAAKTKEYRTEQTFDDDGNLVLPGGMVVSDDFKFEYPETPTSTIYLTSFPRPVSYRRWEFDLNEGKRTIKLLQKKYVGDYSREAKKNARSVKTRTSEVDVSEIM